MISAKQKCPPPDLDGFADKIREIDLLCPYKNIHKFAKHPDLKQSILLQVLVKDTLQTEAKQRLKGPTT